MRSESLGFCGLCKKKKKKIKLEVCFHLTTFTAYTFLITAKTKNVFYELHASGSLGLYSLFM